MTTQTHPDDELVTLTMQLGGKINHEPSEYPIPHPKKSDDISNEEILTMLHVKNILMSDIARKHRFDLLDVLAVINGHKVYPNIARIVAEAIGTTKEMLWPSIYCATPQPRVDMTVFVLRVELP